MALDRWLARLHTYLLDAVEQALESSPGFLRMRLQIAEDERVIAEHIARMKKKYPESYAKAEEEMRRRYFHLHPPEDGSTRD
jgi:hypothetical protein